MKAILPWAEQSFFYLAIGIAAILLAQQEKVLHQIFAGLLLAGGIGYTLLGGIRLFRTYYRMDETKLTVCAAGKTVTVQWSDIASADFDSTAKTIVLITKDGQHLLIEKFDDVRDLATELDVRGIPLNYRKMRRR